MVWSDGRLRLTIQQVLMVDGQAQHAAHKLEVVDVMFIVDP